MELQELDQPDEQSSLLTMAPDKGSKATTTARFAAKASTRVTSAAAMVGAFALLAMVAVVCLVHTAVYNNSRFPSSSSSSNNLRNSVTSPQVFLRLWKSSTASSHTRGLSSPCGSLSQAIFADMHDGDQKIVTLIEDQLTITPSSSSQPDTDEVETDVAEKDWIVHATVDLTTCTALIDFNVPNKPSPPPVPLLLTFWKMDTVGSGPLQHSKWTLEFTDPSGTLAPKGAPLNHWVQIPPVLE